MLHVMYHPQILPEDKHAIKVWEEFQVALNKMLLSQSIRVTGSDHIKWSLSGPDEDGYNGGLKIACAMLQTKFYNFIFAN